MKADILETLADRIHGPGADDPCDRLYTMVLRDEVQSILSLVAHLESVILKCRNEHIELHGKWLRAKELVESMHTEKRMALVERDRARRLFCGVEGQRRRCSPNTIAKLEGWNRLYKEIK